jgi:intracellular septation protein A
MKFLFDLFPVLLFFAAFKMYDIYIATGVAIAATFVQIGWHCCASASSRCCGPASGSSWCSAG